MMQQRKTMKRRKTTLAEQTVTNESACREVAAVHDAVDMNVVVKRILSRMIRTGFSADDLFGMRVALEEAMVNARRHGNSSDPTKTAWVSCYVSPSQIVVEIEDQGLGFDPETIADPLAPENLERPSGRGLFLIRYYMTSVRFNERGNRLTLCKNNSNSK
jgi:serine/threonine-protein kinase RsbW